MNAMAYRIPDPDAPHDRKPAFQVNVFHDLEAGVWLGVSDELPIATEAASFDALLERVWAIAPMMALENGHRSSADDLRLDFVVHTRSA